MLKGGIKGERCGPDLVRVSPEERVLRAEAEAARIEAVAQRGLVPQVCGPDIPAAPARGAFVTVRMMQVVPGSAGTAVAAGYQATGEERPRQTMVTADVFDRMEATARRSHERKGGDGAAFVSPFSPGQVEMARTYRGLVERHSAGGVRCTTALLDGTGGRGDGGGFMDAFVAEGRALDRLDARIGLGMAMALRRIRPSRRGKRARGVITDRRLVWMVCVEDRDLGQVLAAHGWARSGPLLAALRTALAGALDRMRGER